MNRKIVAPMNEKINADLDEAAQGVMLH